MKLDLNLMTLDYPTTVPECWQVANFRTAAGFCADEDWEAFVNQATLLIEQAYEDELEGFDTAEWIDEELSPYRGLNLPTATDETNPYDTSDRRMFMALMEDWIALSNDYEEDFGLNEMLSAMSFANNLKSILASTADRTLLFEQAHFFYDEHLAATALNREDITDREYVLMRAFLVKDHDVDWKTFTDEFGLTR